MCTARQMLRSLMIYVTVKDKETHEKYKSCVRKRLVGE